MLSADLILTADIIYHFSRKLSPGNLEKIKPGNKCYSYEFSREVSLLTVCLVNGLLEP